MWSDICEGRGCTSHCNTLDNTFCKQVSKQLMLPAMAAAVRCNGARFFVECVLQQRGQTPLKQHRSHAARGGARDAMLLPLLH